MTTALVPHVGRLCTGLLILLLGGCAAFRPIHGIPASALPQEYMGESRQGGSTIDLSMLAQLPPRKHYVDAGDVLGIYIEGVLGRPGEAPPVSNPLNPELPPSIGYPFTVRDDGTISLPMVSSIDVRGMTIRQVEERLRQIYVEERDILKEGQDRIIVTLQRPRLVRVLVLRQEAGGPGGNEFAQGVSINLGQTKRGSGQAIELPIYRNDVLHALARTGGLPGLDAENTIYIIRRPHPDDPQLPAAYPVESFHHGQPRRNPQGQWPGGNFQPHSGPAPMLNPPAGQGTEPIGYRTGQRATGVTAGPRARSGSGIQLMSHETPSAVSFAESDDLEEESISPYDRATEHESYNSRQPRWRELLQQHEQQDHSTWYEHAQAADESRDRTDFRPADRVETQHQAQPAYHMASGQRVPHQGGYTIDPVEARNFRSGNPLDELRAPAHLLEETSEDQLRAHPTVEQRGAIAPAIDRNPAPSRVNSVQFTPDAGHYQPGYHGPGYSAPGTGPLLAMPEGMPAGMQPGNMSGIPAPAGGVMTPPLPAPNSRYGQGQSPAYGHGYGHLHGHGPNHGHGSDFGQGYGQGYGQGSWSQTGGLPPAVQEALCQHWQWQGEWQGMGPHGGVDPTMNNPQVIKIPVRLRPGEHPQIRPEDVILQDGDIVFIESRETEIFYTGGLLGGGQFTLPRDYDLDILGAIAIAQGASQQVSLRQLGGVSAINGDVTISASNVIILRQLPNGQQIPIKVDLYRAIRDPSERVLIQPGDIVMLRYKPLEAIGAFVERNLLESALLGIAVGAFPGGGN